VISDATSRLALRAFAIAIAIAALIDPAITSKRSTKPDVVVLAGDSVRDAALADDIARRVAKTYTVTRGPLTGAAATIVAGRSLSARTVSTGAPVFAVTPGIDRPSLSITSLDAPSVAPALSRVRVEATVHVTGARGKNVELSLRDSAVSFDHATRPISRDDDTLHVGLTFIPTEAGPTTIRFIAHVDGTPDAAGDASIDVHAQRWTVLFYDPRPSWMSTFVRRAIERDPRFVVTSRVVTSRGVSTDAGDPPGHLDDLSALGLFDAVVVGAPRALSGNDVAGLEAFLRRRGGSVVLLLDDRDPGPVDRLIGVTAWTTFADNQLMSSAMVDNDSLALQSTNRISPSKLPAGAAAIAGLGEPVVWREPVGAGTLVVSGALDAWRFRDPAMSSFDRFWQTTIGDAASRASAPIELGASHSIVAPGERFDVDATLRDETFDSGARAVGPLEVRATVGPTPDSGAAIHIWPRGQGKLAGRIRAAAKPGLYYVAMSVGGRHARLPFVVAPDSRRVVSGAEARLVDLVHATRGEILPASQLDRLPSLLAAAVRVEPHMVTWHPMRSGWWIIPFVLALSAEWWLRRRRGLP
jgi:hypothetical protein